MKLASSRLLNSPSCHDLFGQVGRRMGKRKGQHHLKRPYKIQRAWQNFQPLLYIFILLLGSVLYLEHFIAGGNLYLGAKMNARLCSENFTHLVLGICNHAKDSWKGEHGYCNWKPSHVGSASVWGCYTRGSWAPQPVLVDIQTTRVYWYPSNLHKSVSWWKQKLSKDFSIELVPMQTSWNAWIQDSADSREHLEAETRKPAKQAISFQCIFLTWGYFWKSCIFYTYNTLSLWLKS